MVLRACQPSHEIGCRSTQRDAVPMPTTGFWRKFTSSFLTHMLQIDPRHTFHLLHNTFCRQCPPNSDAGGSHVEEDLTLDGIVQNVVGQDFPSLHEVFSLIQRYPESSRVLWERFLAHDTL